MESGLPSALTLMIDAVAAAENVREDVQYKIENGTSKDNLWNPRVETRLAHHILRRAARVRRSWEPSDLRMEVNFEWLGPANCHTPCLTPPHVLIHCSLVTAPHHHHLLLIAGRLLLAVRLHLLLLPTFAVPWKH